LDHCFPELVLLNLQLWICEHRDDGVAVPQWYKPYLEGKREAAKAFYLHATKGKTAELTQSHSMLAFICILQAQQEAQ